MADSKARSPHVQVPPRLVTICTAGWPERDRVEMFRERFGGNRIRVEPSADQPLHIDVRIWKLRGLGLLSGSRSALRSDFADGHDRLIFSSASEAVGKQFGREVALQPGDAIALSGEEWGSLTTVRGGPITTVEFPRGALVRMLADARVCCGRRIAKDSPALRLLQGYLQSLAESGAMNSAALHPLAIAHVHDLAALALGAGREAGEIARGRGLRVARLQAIKSDIVENLDRAISLGEIAMRHRVSARYVRMLFESEAISFTGFVLEERLKRAQSMLLSARFRHLRISEIAYRIGFNDLSYFNRAFRRRFGRTPGEVREDRLDEP